MLNELKISTGNGDWHIKNDVIYHRGVLLTLPNIKTFGQAVNYVTKKLGSIEMLLNNDPDRLASTWHIDDVISQSREMKKRVTKPQAREILKRMDADHDATIGINWDTIIYHIEQYFEDQEKETMQAPAEL